MKTIIVFAFVLAASLAHASGDPVPKGKQAMAKSPPPVVVVPGETCAQRVTRECDVANWTKLGKRACIRWKSRQCR